MCVCVCVVLLLFISSTRKQQLYCSIPNVFRRRYSLCDYSLLINSAWSMPIIFEKKELHFICIFVSALVIESKDNRSFST